MQSSVEVGWGYQRTNCPACKRREKAEGGRAKDGRREAAHRQKTFAMGGPGRPARAPGPRQQAWGAPRRRRGRTLSARSTESCDGSSLTGPPSLVGYERAALPGKRPLVHYHWSAFPGPRSLVNYAWSAHSGPRSLADHVGDGPQRTLVNHPGTYPTHLQQVAV